MSTQIRCDCCGEQIVRPTGGDDCPRCGYPVAPEKEEQFLADNLRQLQRVATYGGASLTVKALIARYQQRLNYLWWLRTQQTTPQVTPTMPVQQQRSTARPIPAAESFGTGTPKSVVSRENPGTLSPVVPEKIPAGLPEKLPVAQEPVQPALQVPPVAVMVPVTQPKMARTFSLKAFFADQTINIVASLGAFLILLGSVGFIATTSDPGLKFFTLLVVHALFGMMGAITHRFKTFRIVSVIYTAIFALQVPLVGLAGYLLIPGTSISSSELVAMAAAYAAIVYGVLAIYQRFQPFAYLAAIALTVVDIALAIAFHIDYWWWPSTLMLLALASLICVSPSTGETPLTQKPWDILFQPVRVVMKGYVYTSYACVLLPGLIGFGSASIILSFPEIRFSIAFTLLLLFCWTCLFVWRSHLSKWLLTGPYLLLASILAFTYAFSSPASGYVLVLTGIALLYHGTERFAHKSIQRVKTLRGHIEFLALACLCALPFIADAALPLQVLAQAYGLSFLVTILSPIRDPMIILIDIVALSCGMVLIGSIIISHTRWQKSPSQETSAWCLHLLLIGVLFYWQYNLIGLILPIVPVWSSLAFTGILLLTTIVVRRFTGAPWADPLDILTLVSALQTLLLGIPQGQMVLLALLLTFAGITYAMALYQHRVYLFVLTFVFAILACIPLAGIGQAQDTTPTVLVLLCILLPLVWAILERFLPLARQSAGNSHVFVGSLWTCPVLIISLLYTLEFLSTEFYHPVSTLGLWLHMPQFSMAMELTLLACIWYSTAIVTRKKIGLVAATVLALLSPTHTTLSLTIVAFGSTLIAVSISRLAGRDWGLPFYIIGLLAAFALAGSGQLQFISWALVSFGTFIYLISMIERESLLAAGLRWLAVVFVSCSLYDSGLLSEYAWAPTIAVLGATIGLGIRKIGPRIAPTFADKSQQWSYAGPLYTISLIAAILMGLDGLLLGITQPFYGAIPFALLAYAGIVYGVLVLEKYPQALFLPAVFAIWGLLLMIEMPVAYEMSVGLAMGLVGLQCTRMLKLHAKQDVAQRLGINVQWNWPWYLTFLVAAVLTGGWNLFAQNKADSIFLENGLFAFAALAYVIVLVEDLPLWLGWVSVGLASWSLVEAALNLDSLRLFSIALLCAIAGVLTRRTDRILPSSYQQWWQHKRFDSARLLYSVALAAAILSGFLHTNVPFYAAVPGMLMLYGLIAYGVALWEQRSWFFWFCAGFIIWGACLLPQSALDYEQNWTLPVTAALLAGVTLISALVGLSIGRLSSSAQASIQGLSPANVLRARFRWNWPWYLVAVVSLIVTLVWCAAMPSTLPPYTLNTLTVVLALFLALVFGLMLAERLPDLSLLVIGLAAWLIAQIGWDTWLMACAYSLLCLLVFAGQWLWKRLSPVLEFIPSIWLARVVSFAGLGIVILSVIMQGGLSSDARLLAQSGIFALCIGAILLLWMGISLAPTTSATSKRSHHACYYGAGLLLSLTISWELVAFGHTDVTWLTLAPASYMIIISPFLLHDKQWSELRWLGHSVALGGAMLLLLPTLWSSFDHAEVFPTLLLAAESLLLLVLGTTVRIRFFVLGGAALVIVSAIHLLFLPVLGIPPFLALTLAGAFLLALATALLVVRTRLATVWSEMN